MAVLETNQRKYFFIGTLVLFLGLTILLFSAFFAPLILGAVFAGLSYGLYKKISSALGGQENLSALLVLMIVTLIIIVPIIVVAILLSGEALDVISSAQKQLSGVESIKIFQTISEKFGLDINTITTDYINPIIKSLGGYLSSQVNNLFSNVSRLFIGFFVMLLSIFYFLRDNDKISKFLESVSPLKAGDENKIFNIFKNISGAIVYGSLITAFAQGALGAVGFWIFGIGSPIMWGVLMGFLAFAPLLGPYLIFLPASIYLLTSSSISYTLLFLAYNLIIVSGIDNVLRPKLIGEKVKVHPLIVLLSILGGIKLFGVLGILYGPLIVALTVALVRTHTLSKNISG